MTETQPRALKFLDIFLCRNLQFLTMLGWENRHNVSRSAIASKNEFLILHRKRKEDVTMKKILVFLTISGFFLLGAWAGHAPGKQDLQIPKTMLKGPVKTFSFKNKQEAAGKYNPSLFPEVIKVVSGTGNANANKTTGEFWAVAVDDSLEDNDLCWIGFASNGLRNVGSSDWVNVKISVTVTVSAVNVERSTAIYVTPFAGEQSIADAHDGLSIEKPGTYTVSSRPFNMKPNVDYYVQAVMYLGGMKNKPGGVIGKISSIKFVF